MHNGQHHDFLKYGDKPLKPIYKNFDTYLADSSVPLIFNPNHDFISKPVIKIKLALPPIDPP